MTKRERSMTKGLVLCIALVLPTLAKAADEDGRRSPLADAPAVRNRLELRDKRFELGAGAATTLGQDFYHAVMVNARLGFHLTDWLSIAGIGGFNVSKNFKTSFHERLVSALPAAGPMGDDRAPSVQDAQASMNKIGQIFAGQVEIAPFSGKFSLFSKLFMNYDFYGFGGIGAINFEATQSVCAQNAPACPVTGIKPGANFGIGMHAFVNDFFAINAEVRDILVRNNPAGRDENGDKVADDFDLSWDSNYMLSLNLTFFLPGKARISP